MKRFIKNFWNEYCIYIIAVCSLIISITFLLMVKGCSNTSQNKRLDNCDVTVSEIVVNNHSFLRISESDGFSTVRHLIHNPDCNCLK